MKKAKPTPATLPAPAGAAPQSGHRSGAVAKMVQMPVATLRVWERRYRLTQAGLTSGGQRRYSADDVRRLALIKRLTDLGHAIGSLATLDMPQLQRVAALHAQSLTAAPPAQRSDRGREWPDRTWRLAVVGTALCTRLQRTALLRADHGSPVVLLGPFDDAAQAAAALQRGELDALLIHAPQLHERWLTDFNTAAPGLATVPKAVLYGFAAEAVCEALADAGTALLRDPQPDVVLAQWLSNLSMAALVTSMKEAPPPPRTMADVDDELGGEIGGEMSNELRGWGAGVVPPRRWDDVALVDFAGRLSTVACECPRHVAELLLQLAHFEAYSGECEHRNKADAALHAYLRQIAAVSRARFETALTQVASHEGLLLPSS